MSSDIYIGFNEVYGLLYIKREASNSRVPSTHLGQKVLNAIWKFLRLILGELVEEAIGTNQAVLIRWPVEIVFHNEFSNRVIILFDHGIEVLEDVRVELLILPIGVNEELSLIVFIACCLMHDWQLRDYFANFFSHLFV